MAGLRFALRVKQQRGNGVRVERGHSAWQSCWMNLYGGMSSKKKNQKTNPNKRKNDETVIICPYCGGTHFEYTAEKRRVPSKWYVHVITAIVIIGIAFVMPYFSIAFAIAYVVLTFMPRKVLVGTCKDCGEETLFNRPEDGSMKPSFDQPHL